MIEKYDQSRHDSEAVKELLSLAMGSPTPEKLQKLLSEFYSHDGHTLYITSNNNQLTGIIGIDNTASPHGWITHLAVRPDSRMKGIGRNLINQTAADLSLQSVALETDQDAVDFYRACGFEIAEIASRWPGIRRFRCIRGEMPESVLKYYDNISILE